MSPAMALADRLFSIRETAKSWRRAGLIDDQQLQAIAAAHPDDRNRVGPVFRVLLLGFTILAGMAAFGFFVLGTLSANPGQSIVGILAIFFGLACVLVTEIQTGPGRRRQGGTEAATSFLALGFLLGGSAWLVFEGAHLDTNRGITLLLALGAVLFALADVRWGFPLYGALSAYSIFFLLARSPIGRILWVAVPLGAFHFLLSRSESIHHPPSHRMSFKTIQLVSLLALYSAVHLGSIDNGLIERIFDLRDPSSPASPLLRGGSILATALVPIAILAFGIKTRRRHLLLLGVLLGAASLATLRLYVHLAPLWVVLIGAGAAAIGTALALRRFLESGPNRERRGFTTDQLGEAAEKHARLEMLAAVVTLTPAARPVEPDNSGFTGGGGRSGGGGATDSF